MFKYLLFLLFFFSVFVSVAQECNKRSVYFRSDKHNLKKHEKATIDSLLVKLDPNVHYLVELYAYTDSTNTVRYNYELSSRRNASVMAYIKNIRPENLVFTTKSLGEKTSGDLQENRRVDIYTYPLDDKDRILVEGSMGVKAWISYRNFMSCGYCLGENPTLEPSYLSDKSDEKVLDLEVKRGCPVNENYRCDTAEFRIPSAVFNGSPSKFNRKVYAYRYSKWHGITENMKSDSLFRVAFDTLTNEYVIYYDCYNKYQSRFILCGGYRPPCFNFQFVFPSNIDSNKISISFDQQPEKHHFPKAFSQVGIPGTLPEMSRPVPENKEKFWYLRYSGAYSLEKNQCPPFISVFSYGTRDGNLVFAKFELEKLRSILNGGELIYYRDGKEKEQHFVRLKVPDELYKPLKYTNVKIKLTVPKSNALDSLGIYLEPYDFFIPIKQIKKNKYEAMLPEMEFDMAVYDGGKETVIPFQKIKKRYKKRKYVLKMKIRKQNGK